jgi:hypothetical protein
VAGLTDPTRRRRDRAAWDEPPRSGSSRHCLCTRHTLFL